MVKFTDQDATSGFAVLVDQGMRAYQRAQDLRQVGIAEQYIAAEIGVGASTVNAWRRHRIPHDYMVLTQFAAACVAAAPELDAQWVTDLFREAKMAGYRDQALVEVFKPRPAAPNPAALTTGLVAGRPTNIAGTVPAPPDYYVPRHAKLETLKALTLAQCDTGGWIVILGMTGVGKSALMAALGREADIQAAFSGNVRWFEVRLTTTTQRLAQRIAQAFGQELPDGSDSINDEMAALRRILPAGPVLLLLDNVVNPAVITALHALGPRVVVIVRAIQDVALLRLPEKAWFTLGELTTAEAWALVTQIIPVPAEQIPAAQTVLELLEYHPYVTVVAASAALALDMQWDEVLDAIRAINVRRGVIQFLQTKNCNLWAPLELDWERLGRPSQYALSTLGRLPHFLHYDLALAQAVWGLSDADARRVWKGLVAMQLARPAPDFPGEYAVHWLIRDFAAEKARHWSLGQRLRFLDWPWRYQLPFRLRWWWPALRKPESGPRWPWWSPHLPGTEGCPGWQSLRTWLITKLWQQDGRKLNLRAGPVEWVTTTRLWVRLLAAGLATLGLNVAAVITLLQGRVPYGIVLAIVIAVWVTLVAYTDLRRAALWWGLATSLPYTAAFGGCEQEKDPVS